MKAGRSLQAIAQELERQIETRKDFVAPTEALSIVADTDVRLAGLNGDPLDIKPYAHRQIAEEVGIPAKYYDRMREAAPALLAQNVNHWFHAEPKRRLVRTLDHDVRAFLSDRYRPLDNYDLAEVVLPTLQQTGCRVESAELTDTRLYIKAILPSLELEVRGSRQRGDVVQAGIVISNSEVGAGAVRIEPLIFRLVCLNGAIAQDAALRKYHVGKLAELEAGVREMLTTETRRADDRAFWLKVRDVVKAAFDRDVFARIVARMSETTGQRIEGDVQKVVEVTTVKFGLAERVGKSVLSHLIEGGDLSRWGLANAITRASQDVDDYDEATALERVGGKVIELAPSEWQDLSTAA